MGTIIAGDQYGGTLSGISESHQLRGADVLLFVDNSAAISAFVKGRSGSLAMDALARKVHLQTYAMDTRLWLEYVEATANWADGVSRDVVDNAWALQNHFTLRAV